MNYTEIEKITKDIRRSLGKKFGYRQSDYINWKIKDGYFFCLNTLHIVNTELEVKPLYLDDLYWEIIYPDRGKKLSDSLRGNGVLSFLCVPIWKEWFPKDLKKTFTAEQYEQLFYNVYLNAEKEIGLFLQKYTDPSFYPQFMTDNNIETNLSAVLNLIYKGDFDAAYQKAKGLINSNGVRNTYVIGEGENSKYKSEYEFIMDYCSEKLSGGK